MSEINLHRWFPPSDPLAATVARMCILREDFAIELQGMLATNIEPLDANTAVWRKVYFWRNLVRTLQEISSTLKALNSIPEFTAALENHPDWKERFRSLEDTFTKKRELIKEIRNNLGGHIFPESEVEKALGSIGVDRCAHIEIGMRYKDTHYKFALELVEEVLLAGVPEEQRDAERTRKFQGIYSLLPVFHLTDVTLQIYRDIRKLDD